MRTSTRLLGAVTVAVAAMSMGAPAFADEDEKPSVSNEADSGEAGDAGDGGENANVLSCLVNLPILSPNSDQECNPTADGGEGGDSEAEAGNSED